MAQARLGWAGDVASTGSGEMTGLLERGGSGAETISGSWDWGVGGVSSVLCTLSSLMKRHWREGRAEPSLVGQSVRRSGCVEAPSGRDPSQLRCIPYVNL